MAGPLPVRSIFCWPLKYTREKSQAQGSRAKLNKIRVGTGFPPFLRPPRAIEDPQPAGSPEKTTQKRKSCASRSGILRRQVNGRHRRLLAETAKKVNPAGARLVIDPL